MKKSVRKTAGGNRVPDKHSTTKRVWFPRGDGIQSSTFDDQCDKKGLVAVRSFESWNANEGNIALVLGKHDEILMFDGEGRPWLFTPAEAMAFMAEMCHEAEAGTHYWGERYFYEVIATALKAGAR